MSTDPASKQPAEETPWYFRVLGPHRARIASRLLQLLDRQQLEAEQFHATLVFDSVHLDFHLHTTPELARRVGLLARRLPGVQSALWFEHTPPARTALSLWSEIDTPRDTDPGSDFWLPAPAISLHADNFAVPVPGYQAEVRSRWTERSLYFLFRCNFQTLSPLPSLPILDSPTPALWTGDVSEIFLGDPHTPLRHYDEFELSPRSEWLALRIVHDAGGTIHRTPHPDGFTAATRVDHAGGMWYAFFRVLIPKAQPTFRVNFFLSQGAPAVELSWQPTHAETFHVPSAFGTLILIEP